MTEASELWHISPSVSELRETNPEPLRHDEVVVKSLFSMISLGTERTVCTGNVPSEAWEDMRVPYMQGSFSFPCTYGYSLTGIVTDGAEELKGQLVHVMHPHQTHIKIRKQELSIIPYFIPPKRATLASNMETAINALWDSGVSAGDKVLIIGFGMIGGLVGLLACNIPGVKVDFLEKSMLRAKSAQGLGFEIISESQGLDQDYDVAFNTSGSEAGLQTCINAIGNEGKVIELSWYGTNEVNLKLGRDFHYKRKQIISSQVSHIPSFKSNRWDFKRRKELVFKLLQDDTFDKLITLEVPFSDSPVFYNNLRTGNINDIGVVISY